MAKVKVVAPTREELVSTAQEVSAILGLDTPIKITKKMTDEDVIEAIKAAADGNVYESDFEDRSDEEGEEEGVSFFSALADQVMQKIKVDVVPGTPPVAGEEEVEEVIEDEEEVEEAPAPKAVKAKAEKPAKAPKAEKAPKAKKEEKTKYTRANAFADAVIELNADKKAVKLEDLANAANDIYVNAGNNPNIKEAKWYQGTILPCLVALDLAVVENDTFKLTA